MHRLIERTTLALAFGLLAAASPARADDHVYTSDLMTRWGKQVTPDNVWQSYPDRS